MKKWINTFLHGDKKTIVYIVSIIVGSLITVLCAIAAVMKLSFLYGAISVFVGVITGILLQNYTLYDSEYDSDLDKESKVGKEEKKVSLLNQIEQGTMTQEKELFVPSQIPKKNETVFENYGEKKIEQLLRNYKAKQDYRRIIIDSCACFRVQNCPAYIWKNKKCLCILLIEEEPRYVSIPLKAIPDIYYERGVLVKNKEEYECFKKPSYITSIFSPYLPNYYEKIQEKQKKTYKNLYVIGNELKVTNTSARNLFDILELEFSVDDTVMDAARFSPYFKLAYKSNILLLDRVIGTEEYKQRIQMIVMAVADDEEESYEFENLLEQLIETKLITKEYGDYYREMKK